MNIKLLLTRVRNHFRFAIRRRVTCTTVVPQHCTVYFGRRLHVLQTLIASEVYYVLRATMTDCCCYWVLVLAGRKDALPWQQRVNVCWCMLTCRRRPQRQPSSTRHLVTSYGGDEEEMLPLEPDIGKLEIIPIV